MPQANRRDEHHDDGEQGGDVFVLSKDIVAVGLSQRTTVSGAETFARNLLQNSDFKVLAFDIPETRAFMHLIPYSDIWNILCLVYKTK